MKNQPGNMKNQPGTMKNHENRLGTMENRPGTINKQKRYKQTHRSFLLYIDIKASANNTFLSPGSAKSTYLSIIIHNFQSP